MIIDGLPLSDDAAEVIRWGHPWHGLVRGGVLDTGLPDPANPSTTIQVQDYPQPTGGDVFPFRVPGVPDLAIDPDTLAADAALGHQWRDYALLSGYRRQLYRRPLFSGTAPAWLYARAVGNLYRLEITSKSATGDGGGGRLDCTILAQPFLLSATPQPSRTITVSMEGIGQPQWTGDGAPADITMTRVDLAGHSYSGARAMLALWYGGAIVGWIELVVSGDSLDAIDIDAVVYRSRAACWEHDCASDCAQSNRYWGGETRTVRQEDGLGGYCETQTTTSVLVDDDGLGTFLPQVSDTGWHRTYRRNWHYLASVVYSGETAVDIIYHSTESYAASGSAARTGSRIRIECEDQYGAVTVTVTDDTAWRVDSHVEYTRAIALSAAGQRTAFQATRLETAAYALHHDGDTLVYEGTNGYIVESATWAITRWDGETRELFPPGGLIFPITSVRRDDVLQAGAVDAADAAAWMSMSDAGRASIWAASISPTQLGGIYTLSVTMSVATPQATIRRLGYTLFATASQEYDSVVSDPSRTTYTAMTSHGPRHVPPVPLPTSSIAGLSGSYQPITDHLAYGFVGDVCWV